MMMNFDCGPVTDKKIKMEDENIETVVVETLVENIDKYLVKNKTF